MTPEFRINTANFSDVYNHLIGCDQSFVPTLSKRVDITAYAQKLVENSEMFEAWANNELIGLIAVYCNDPAQEEAYISSVSVLAHWMGKGIASRLLSNCLAFVHKSGFKSVGLEVGVENAAAISLYLQNNFSTVSHKDNVQEMVKKFGSNS